jgi:hypothetical protein
VRPFFIRLRSSRSSGVIAASASRRLALERLAALSRLFLGGPKTTILSRSLRDLYHSRSPKWSVNVFQTSLECLHIELGAVVPMLPPGSFVVSLVRPVSRWMFLS